MTSAADTWRPAVPELAVDGAGLVQTVDYQPGSAFGPRLLVDHEFVWLLEGAADWTWRRGSTEERLRLEPGQLLLATPGAVDSYSWHPDRVSRHAWAHFRVVGSADLPPEEDWPRIRSLHRAPVLGALCDYLLELAASPRPGARARSDQVLGLLLDLFVRGPLDEAAEPGGGHLAAALAAVRERWADGPRILDVDELAVAVGVSAGHLFRLFREAYGCGPAHALELVRLSRAALVLQRSNASLGEVAAACGFANAYHFSRRFRSAYGVPPGRYRRTQPGADPLGPVRAAGLLPVAQALRPWHGSALTR